MRHDCAIDEMMTVPCGDTRPTDHVLFAEYPCLNLLVNLLNDVRSVGGRRSSWASAKAQGNEA